MITISNQPASLEPVKTPIWFIIDSIDSSSTNYKYVVNVNTKNEPFSTAATVSQSYKLPPRPTGECQFTPNKWIKSFFDFTVNPYLGGWGTVSGGYIEYSFDYGFEYNPEIDFTNVFSTGGTLSLTFSTTHPFEVGDIIRVDKDNKQVNPGYDGTSSVTATGSNFIVLDKAFVASNVTESGSVTSLYRIENSTSDFYAFYAGREYNQRTTDFGNYLISPTQSNNNFLTTYNQTYKKVFVDDYETVSFLLDYAGNYTGYVEKYDANGNILGTMSDSLSKTKYYRMDYGVGPANIIADTGSASFFDGVDTYKFWIECNDSVTMTYSTSTYSYDITTAPAGTYNSKVYYTWTDTYNTFFLWNDTTDWYITNALGGGTDYLVSTTASGSYPTVGSKTGGEWTDALTPLFTTFELSLGGIKSEELQYKIVENCDSVKYDPVRLCFMNKLGGYDYFTFTLDSRKDYTIDRSTYKQVLDWNYSMGSRGERVFAKNVEELITVNSNWINESDSEWLKELLASEDVYHVKSNGELHPIVIIDNSYEVKTYMRNELFNLSLTFRYASPNNI